MKRMILIYANSRVEHICDTNTFEPDLTALHARGVVHIIFKYEYTDWNGGHKSVEIATIDLN